jgi:hypothetical protein
MEGGVTFSFLLFCASLLLRFVFCTRWGVSFIAGTGVSDWTLEPGTSLGDLVDSNDAVPSVGDFECTKEAAPVLLERLPLSIKGNCSFIGGDLGVSGIG